MTPARLIALLESLTNAARSAGQAVDCGDWDDAVAWLREVVDAAKEARTAIQSAADAELTAQFDRLDEALRAGGSR